MQFKTGNLLEADVEALVNTVNTVGVMGKGIALMFKERFPENYREYAAACKAAKVRVGEMFATPGVEFGGPKWIINFPTKEHWRQPTKLEWIDSGLSALKQFLIEKRIRSIAIPPLGCGNGGLDWDIVRPMIEKKLGDLKDVDILIFEPTARYQNVAKKFGVEKLTPARAIVAEMIRRYLILGMECTLLEAQKLAWFLERVVQKLGIENPLDLRFEANRYGPYAERLKHLLNGLDGSYLHCDKRLADATAFETIWFVDAMKNNIDFYLKSRNVKPYMAVIEATDELIDGFQSPLGMEALATVDWLISREGVPPTLSGIRHGIQNWRAGTIHAERKNRIFSDRLLELAITRLVDSRLP